MRPIYRHLCAFTVAIATSASAQTTILHNATLIDGTGAPARQHVDITLSNGLITSVAPAAASTPKGAVDCTGKTIIPGLISAHSHVGMLISLSRAGLRHRLYQRERHR